MLSIWLFLMVFQTNCQEAISSSFQRLFPYVFNHINKEPNDELTSRNVLMERNRVHSLIHPCIHPFIHYSFIIHPFLSPCVPDGPVAWLPRHFRTADLTGSLKVPRLRRWSGGIDQCVWFQLCHSWKWQQWNHQTRIKQFKVRTNLSAIPWH